MSSIAPVRLGASMLEEAFVSLTPKPQHDPAESPARVTFPNRPATVNVRDPPGARNANQIEAFSMLLAWILDPLD